MALYDPRISALFGAPNPNYAQELQMQVARELGLIGQEWVHDENTGQGRMMDGQIKDPQAVIRELQRRDFEQYVPGDVRAGLGASPVNYGVGSEVLRDSQGRALGAVRFDDGTQTFLPWDVAQRHSQLGAQLGTQYQEASSNPLKDPMFLAMIGAGTGIGLMGGGAAAGAGAAEAGAATGAFDAGIGGVAESMGLGAGYTSPAMGGLSFPVGAYDPANPLMFGSSPVDGLNIGSSLGSTGNPGSYLTGAGLESTGNMYLDQYLAGSLGTSSAIPNTGAAVGDVSGGGGASTSGGAPMPPSPGGSSIFDKAKALAPYAPLLGMAAGGLAGAAGGGGSAGTITVEEGIPDWLMPYVKPQLDAYSTQLQNYQTDPYGIMPAAANEFKNTISGMYLDPSTNKWLEEYYKLGAERVKGTVSPSFGHMQAFGSHSGYNEALSRGLADMAVGLYGGAYNKERDRQAQMTSAAPSFLTQQSTAAFAPYNQYLSTVGSLGKKKDQPYWEPSTMQNIMGGAMMGYGLGNIFK
jgi:hypothetical protein